MTLSSRTALLVEDDPQIRRVLRTLLSLEQFRIVEAETAALGISAARTHKPDLVIVDLGLPDRDGLEVIRGIRAWSRVPVIVLSARTSESEKVGALEAGADDYITKPFGARELSARVKVALRHSAGAGVQGTEILVGDWRIDLQARTVLAADGRQQHLTPIEFRLLEVLAEHIGFVVTHRVLLTQVWGPGSTDQTHYLRVYMKQLRNKLESDPARPRWLLTETGVGYRLAQRDYAE